MEATRARSCEAVARAAEAPPPPSPTIAAITPSMTAPMRPIKSPASSSSSRSAAEESRTDGSGGTRLRPGGSGSGPAPPALPPVDRPLVNRPRPKSIESPPGPARPKDAGESVGHGLRSPAPDRRPPIPDSSQRSEPDSHGRSSPRPRPAGARELFLLPDGSSQGHLWTAQHWRAHQRDKGFRSNSANDRDHRFPELKRMSRLRFTGKSERAISCSRIRRRRRGFRSRPIRRPASR